VRNKTGVDIEKIFISPADVNDWEEDILLEDLGGPLISRLGRSA